MKPVTEIIIEILGRLPNDTELQKYSAMKAQGTTEQQLRKMIAQSEEARLNIENILRQYLGRVNPQALQFWQQTLVQNKSIHEVEKLIQQWSL